MTSFVDIIRFFANPFTDIVVVAINVFCFNAVLRKAEMSQKLTVIPALPYMAGMGISMWIWSQNDWTSHISANVFGFVEPIAMVFNFVPLNSLLTGTAYPVSTSVPFWIEFLMYFGVVSLLVNWFMFMYLCVARWPVLNAKQDLEAAVGRQSGRQVGDRSSAFVGESGLDASAPVAALLNRPPRSAYDTEKIGAAAYAGKRGPSDAERVADLQRQVKSGTGQSPLTAAAPGGTARTPVSDAARVAELISSIQPMPSAAPPAPAPIATSAGHCTVCGAVLLDGALHSCPLAGGQSMFCGRCGTSHDRSTTTCAHCGSALA